MLGIGVCLGVLVRREHDSTRLELLGSWSAVDNCRDERKYNTKSRDSP